MKFIDGTQGLNFDLGILPVMVVTLKKTEWMDRKGQPYKEKKLNKIWADFQKNYIDGRIFNQRDGYFSLMLENKPEASLTSDEITEQKEYAVVLRDVARLFGNLPDDAVEKLWFAIRFLNRDGRFVVFDDLDTEINEGGFDEVAECFNQVVIELSGKEKEKMEIAEDTAKNKGFEKGQLEEKMNEIDSSFFNDIPSQENNNSSILVEEVKEVESNNNQNVFDETNTLPEEEEYIQADDLVKGELANYINNMVKVSLVENDLGHFGENFGAELLPVVEVKKDSILNKADVTNRELLALGEEAKKSLLTLLENEVDNRLSNLLDRTDVSVTDSPYHRAINKLERDYKRHKSEIEMSVEVFRKEKEKDFALRREDHIKTIVQNETVRFNSEQTPIMEAEVEKFETDLLAKLEQAHDIGVQDIETQATQEFENKVKSIVSQVVSDFSSDISSIINSYVDDVAMRRSEFDKYRTEAVRSLEKEVSQIMTLQADYSRREAGEIDAKVKAKLPELYELQGKFKISEEGRLFAEKRLHDVEASLVKLREEYADTESKFNSLKTQNSDLETKLLSARETFEADENVKKSRLRTFAKYSLSGLLAILVATVGTTVYISSQNNQSLKKEVDMLKSELSAKYRVGEYVPVDTGNGSVSYGKVTKISKGTVFVNVKGADGLISEYKFKE